MAIADRSPARYIFELNWRICRAARLAPDSDLRASNQRPFEVDRAAARIRPPFSDFRRRFLRSRSVPACLRSLTMRMAEA